MKLYSWTRKNGVQKLTWLPLYSWPEGPGTTPPSKSDRMEEEGWMIFERQSDLNTAGRSRGEEQKNVMGERMLLGRRRRTRQLMRFRHKKKNEIIQTFDPANRQQRPTQCKILPIVMRMARRPWKASTDMDTMRVVRRLRELTPKMVSRLMALAQTVLDPTGRSIFQQNIQKAFRNSSKIAIMNVTLRSPLFAVKGVEEKVLQQLRRWLHRWSKQGITVLLRTTLALRKGQSIMSILDSSSAWAKKPRGVERCACKTELGNSCQKIDGHIFQPLRKILHDKFNIRLPDGWTVCSKLCPDFEKEVQKVQKALEELDSRTEVRIQKKAGHSQTKAVGISCQPAHLLERCQEWKSHNPKTVEVQTIESVKPAFRDVVVCPIDKLMSDAAVICVQKWNQAVRKMSENLVSVGNEEFQYILENLFSFGNNLVRIPFSRLTVASRHQFGPLRVWPKRKCFVNWPEDWSQVLWRPLVSYFHHHWRRLVGIAGRFCSYSTQFLGWGLAQSRPSRVTQLVDEFNVKEARRKKFLGAFISEIEWQLQAQLSDLKEFFTFVDIQEFLAAVRAAVLEVHEALPEMNWF